MSINIPAETPDESDHPISVEEFEHLHPAMLEAIGKAVREELELSHADGRTSADVQRTFDLQLVVPGKLEQIALADARSTKTLESSRFQRTYHRYAILKRGNF